MENYSRKMDDINYRIRKIRVTFFKNSNKEFSERCGIDSSSLSMFCSGTRQPGMDHIDKILKACPQVSDAWLKYGKGDMMEKLPVMEDPSAMYDSSSHAKDANDVRKEEPREPLGSHMGGAREVELMGEIIKMKDDMIEQLKARIEDQRVYIKILSEEHRALVHQVIEIGDSNNELLKDLQRRAIGFEVGGITKK